MNRVVYCVALVLVGRHSDMQESARVGMPMLDAAMSSLIRGLKDRGSSEVLG